MSFVAKSNWQLALAIGNIFTLATLFNLDFAPRFARIEAANAKGREMARRKIQELTTGVHDFPTTISERAAKCVDRLHLVANPPAFLVGANYDPARRGIDDSLVEKA